MIFTDYSGYRLDLVKDGSMVGIGTEYARVYSESFDEATVAELEEIEKTLDLLESSCVFLAPGAVKEYNQKVKEGAKLNIDIEREMAAMKGEEK